MRKIVVFVYVIALFLLSSCSPVIGNDADEIRLNRWSRRFRSGSTATLCFDGDRAEFTVKSKDSKARLRLSGLCVFDSEKFALYDEGDEYVFRYKLKGNRLTLVYDEGRITLLRK